MTRDALAQLLLCYIGTAADIIEFFDSFKVIIFLILQSINLCSGPEGEHWQGALPCRDVYLVLVTHAVYNYCPGIKRKRRYEIIFTKSCFKGKAMNLDASCCDKTKEICCNLDVWGILITVISQVFLKFVRKTLLEFQDAPFFAFRLVIIIHYRLISSMNLFCTAKNTLVITLQVPPS